MCGLLLGGITRQSVCTLRHSRGAHPSFPESLTHPVPHRATFGPGYPCVVRLHVHARYQICDFGSFAQAKKRKFVTACCCLRCAQFHMGGLLKNPFTHFCAPRLLLDEPLFCFSYISIIYKTIFTLQKVTPGLGARFGACSALVRCHRLTCQLWLGCPAKSGSGCAAAPGTLSVSSFWRMFIFGLDAFGVVPLGFSVCQSSVARGVQPLRPRQSLYSRFNPMARDTALHLR